MRSNPYLSNYEATSSWCRRFALNVIIPEIVATPEIAKGASFRLVDYVNKLISEYLTEEQLRTEYIRPESNKPISVAASIKFWCGWTSKYGKRSPFVHEGNGYYRFENEEEVEVEEFDTHDNPDIEGSTGFIYAFTFPSLIKSNSNFPIKVGMTTNNVERRVISQCKTSGFEMPKILGSWKVKRVENFEYAIHKILSARGKMRENAIGNEWFNTTLEEIETIIKFIDKD